MLESLHLVVYTCPYLRVVGLGKLWGNRCIWNGYQPSWVRVIKRSGNCVEGISAVIWLDVHLK